MLDINHILLTLFCAVPVLLLGFTIHEMCHAYASYQLGDPTAKYDGRITLNPIPHLDPIGTTVLLITSVMGMPFGWARPVRYSPNNLRRPRQDSAIIAAVGPLSNLAMAFLFGLLFRLGVAEVHPIVHTLAWLGVIMNVGLFLFNMIPLPPLDGSKVLKALVPERTADSIDDFEERYGRWIPLALLFLMTTLLRGPYLFVAGALYQLATGQ